MNSKDTIVGKIDWCQTTAKQQNVDNVHNSWDVV